MVSLSLYTAVAAAVSVVGAQGAQSSSTCNPLKQSCKPVKALGKSVTDDFHSKPSNYKAINAAKAISYGKTNGATFTISKSGDNPTIESDFHIMFGTVEADVQAAPGTGIVSTLMMQSDDLDEIDWEWLGGKDNQVQSNWFPKGQTTGANRGQFHNMKSSPLSKWHTYKIEWSKDNLRWYIDGEKVRDLASSTDGFPQTPMTVRIGSWAGGDSTNPQGTIDWAGGPTDYSKGPFNMYVKNVKVQDYSTGKEYRYKDQSGKWTSIEAVGGKVNGNAKS